MGTEELNARGSPACDGLASHPGKIEILIFASSNRNQDKLGPDGPLGSYAGFTYPHPPRPGDLANFQLQNIITN